MLRFQKGDASAFETLVERNTAKIHSLVFRFLGEPSQVEDLTQEVFMRIYSTAKRYQPQAKFSTWLYRITANLCFNVLRSRGKAHAVSLEASIGREDGEGCHHDVADGQTPGVHEQIALEELRSQVNRAVHRLPENQRIAIILSKFQDKSYEDIGAVLGCTTMAVKSLLSRARGNLRQMLGLALKMPVEESDGMPPAGSV